MSQDAPEIARFLGAEIAEIEKDKWIESEKAHRDLGKDALGRPSDTFFIQWVSKHGEDFRKKWDKSCCKSCQCFDCHTEPKEDCPNYTSKLALRIVKYESRKLDFEVVNLGTGQVINRYILLPSKNKEGKIEAKLVLHNATRRFHWWEKLCNRLKIRIK